MVARFHHRENITHDIRTFWFTSKEKIKYQAGQYCEVTLNGSSRWHTLSSSPTEPLIGFTTKFSEPLSEFKTDLLSINPGHPILMSEPLGDYVLPKDPNVPLVFISGGIGITPVRSIVKFLTDKKEKRNIQLIYAVRHENDLAFNKLFTSYKLTKYIPVISQPTSVSSGKTGRLNTKRVLSMLSFNDLSIIYVSGPQGMVEKLCFELAQTLNRTQIVMDYFPGYKDI